MAIKVVLNVTDRNGLAGPCISCNADAGKCHKIEFLYGKGGNGHVVTLCNNCMLELIARCSVALMEDN